MNNRDILFGNDLTCIMLAYGIKHRLLLRFTKDLPVIAVSTVYEQYFFSLAGPGQFLSSHPDVLLIILSFVMIDDRNNIGQNFFQLCD